MRSPLKVWSQQRFRWLPLLVVSPGHRRVAKGGGSSGQRKGHAHENTRGIHRDDAHRRRADRLPISIAMLLLAKTVNGLLALLAAVTAQIPAGAAFCQIVAILLLVAVCLIVRTSAGEFVRAMKQPAVLPGANPARRVES